MKCKTCGKNAESEYCFQHKPRKGFKKVVHTLKTVKKSIDYRKIFDRNDFFLQIWKKKRHCSEVSGEYLGNEPLTVFFHHILPKEKFPEAEYDEDNIILLTFDEHNNVEMNMYKYPEVNVRRDKLNLKYERT
jgi:hypothetical protein